MSGAIVVVDDSLTVRMDLVDAFEHLEMKVVGCSSLAEARTALARADLGLVILDVVLPDGSGIDLLRELRAMPATQRIPVLILSSQAEVADRVRGFETGASEYVGKPYDLAHVVARARQLLGIPTPAEGGRPTILVIDDSPTYRASVARALEEAGYTVLVADTGEQGLRMVADTRPSAIVVDGMLPGIDGAAVIRRIRLDGALRTTPCVLLTGSEGPSAELDALDAGADAFARKGEDFAVLVMRLAVLLRDGARGTQRLDLASLHAPKRILAVDDSPTYLHELGDALRSDGYDVILARSGEEAIELLGLENVDCVLMDLMMPGMGGQQACSRIKSSAVLRETPLIMLTALDDRDAMIDGLTAGADDYISKSSDFLVLRARVRAQLRRKQFEGEARGAREQLLRTQAEAVEARAARRLAETKAALVEELERKNRELEAFSYSVSHDLRAPLRTIDGFSQILVEDFGDLLPEAAHQHLARVRAAAQRMGVLIDDLLSLSRVTRADLHRTRVDLSELARSVCADLERKEPGRRVRAEIEDHMEVEVDRGLARILLENLLGNAWKFTARTAEPQIRVGRTFREGVVTHFVSDNGAGFDPARAHQLFRPFQRLHRQDEFPGTGVGLATVQRIVDRHGGRVVADAIPDGGATFYFTLPAPREEFPPLDDRAAAITAGRADLA